jgi:hypothetical protein
MRSPRGPVATPRRLVACRDRRRFALLMVDRSSSAASTGGLTMSLFKSKQEIKQEQKRRNSPWYSLSPKSLLVVTAYVGVLLFLPIMRGEVMDDGTIVGIALHVVKAMLGAMLVAWLFWRLSKKSDSAANNMFCLIICLVAVWTQGLSEPQRAAASSIVEDTIGKPVGAVSDTVSEWIDKDQQQ